MVSYSFQGNKRLWTPRDEDENEKIFSPQSNPTGIKIPDEIKPIYLANAECEIEKWPVTQIMRLLRLYAGHCCLWDVSCADNRNRKMRQAALVDITAALGGGVTKDQVVQKINVVRATYRYEKKRIKQRIRRGLGAKTKLKWFALADAFLRKVPKKGQKNEFSYNSDSDLEDTIVFSINAESLVPMEPENFMASSTEIPDNEENLVVTKQEIFSDDLESFSAMNKDTSHDHCEISIDDNSEDNIPLKTLKLEMSEYDNQTETEDRQQNTKVQSLDNNSSHKITSNPERLNQNQLQTSKSSFWNLEHSLQLIKHLQSHPILWTGTMTSCETLQTSALEVIARNMEKPLKSIAKRVHILRQTCEMEKQKMLENLQYKPKYEWWPEIENLLKTETFMHSEKLTESSIENQTESIFLQETENSDTSDDNEDYGNFLLNPIPSVAPLSNMNEAMESLFHQQEHEDNECLESTTNSAFPKEDDFLNSTKFVWHGLEDDLLEGKWSLKHSVKFLRLYGVHKCLWDLTDPDYRCRPLRNAAMEDIAALMGHGLTAAYVAKKIKIFRITYMQQRKRILDATEKGETPEILLKWFPLADSFLRPHIGLRSIKSDAKEMPQFDYQYVYANLNLIDPALLTDFRGKGTQNAIEIGNASDLLDIEDN